MFRVERTAERTKFEGRAEFARGDANGRRKIENGSYLRAISLLNNRELVGLVTRRGAGDNFLLRHAFGWPGLFETFEKVVPAMLETLGEIIMRESKHEKAAHEKHKGSKY